MLTAAYLNSHSKEGAETVEPADLIPSMRKAKPSAADVARSRLAQFQALKRK